ncbi:STAS domain-containing protein [Actinoplanes oblitus]|uniref:STAS domain-containing protein n=1 Tax=Actinoplanes oblitus TaxID=3040509 RepID=A0ABY8WHR9_9ACTN|nr:STAS domain-containing protein [Actinoplanes oblitus]WIM97223.1 STAS domain-containing protein [Actinoplanes oblitus]
MTDDSPGRLPRGARMHRTASTVTIILSGEFDLMARYWMPDFIVDTIDATLRHIVLDLSELAFIDVAGLRILLDVHDISIRNGITLTLRRPPSCLVWLLDTCGVTDLLIDDDSGSQYRDDDQPPAHIPTADPARHSTADERGRAADERDRAADERDRAADERDRQINDHQRWEDIREDRANQRERDLEARERSDLP